MAFPLIPILIGLAAGAAGTAAGAAASRKNTKDQIKYSREEAEKERASQLDMWNKTNAFNSPTEQMARMQAAGLNPQLAYGSGNVGGLSASPAPGYKRADTPDFSKRESILGSVLKQAPQMLSMYQDYRMRNAQIDISQAEAKYREVMLWGKEDLLTSQRQIAASKSLMSQAQAKVAPEMVKYTLQGKEAAVQQMRQQTRGLELENDLNALLKPYGITTKDNAALRQIVRVLQKDNPNISAIDAALLIPMIMGLK